MDGIRISVIDGPGCRKTCFHSILEIDAPLASDVIRYDHSLDRGILEARIKEKIHVGISQRYDLVNGIVMNRKGHYLSPFCKSPTLFGRFMS